MKMSTLLSLLLSAGLLLSPSVLWAKKNLDLSGVPLELRNDLIRRYPFVETDKVSLEQIDEVIRFLQLRPQFNRVQVIDAPDSSSYKIQFDYARNIGFVKIQGAKSLSNFESESTFAIKSGDVFDQQELIEQGEKLRQLYQDKGFLNASIDIEMPPGAVNTVDVLVKVTENKKTRISKIIIQSPNENLNKKLHKEIKGYIYEDYTDKELGELTKDMRKYLAKNHYVRADITGPSLEFNSDESLIQLTYRVDKVDRYTFQANGMRFVNRGDILDSLDLENYNFASSAVGADLSQKIKALYLSKGYARVEINVEEKATEKAFEHEIVFNIEEGPQIKIENIIMGGRFSKPPKYYIDFIEEHSSKVIADHFYNKDDFDIGLRNLTLELQNNGYLLAKVLSTRSQYNKTRDKVTLYVNIDEGPLTKVEAISFEGNTAFPEAELLKVTNLKIGALRLNQIENAVAEIKNYYQERGYIEMLLLNERDDLVRYDDNNTAATLHFKIYEGPQVHVASIILEGNTFTKDSVLLHELEFKDGDLVTPAKLEESIARLQRTGFFSSVEIKTLEEKTNVANRTMLIKVTERDPGLFLLGIGATNERKLTIRGYAGIAYRNLFGTGRGVSLRLEGNYNVPDIRYLESRIVLGYIEPYIFETRVRGRINITRSQEVTDYDLKQVTEVNSTTYSFEKDFTSHILGVWDIWSLATYRDFGLDDTYPEEYKLEQNIATTGPSVDLDFRDNPFVPTKGTLTRVNAEYSTPDIGSSSTIEYWRSTASLTLYNLIDHWQKQPVVWANQVRGGYIKNLSSLANGGIPWDKKGFTLGGRSTVRGYEAGTQEVFPNKEDLGTDKYFLTTESSMFLIKSELRFPVYGNLGGAVFYDGGAVLIEDLEFEKSYRASAGFGVRYNTPVGPLSLELAWKLDQRPGESPWRFHLAIGTF